MVKQCDYKTLKETFEYIDVEYGDGFSYELGFYQSRDNFYDYLKYELMNKRISHEEAFRCIDQEPVIQQDLLYAYACAYCEWVAHELEIEVPEWVYSDRGYCFANFFITTFPIRKKDLERESRVTFPSDEFAARGFYVMDKDQDVC